MFDVLCFRNTVHWKLWFSELCPSSFKTSRLGTRSPGAARTIIAPVSALYDHCQREIGDRKLSSRVTDFRAKIRRAFSLPVLTFVLALPTSQNPFLISKLFVFVSPPASYTSFFASPTAMFCLPLRLHARCRRLWWCFNMLCYCRRLYLEEVKTRGRARWGEDGVHCMCGCCMAVEAARAKAYRLKPCNDYIIHTHTNTAYS